MVKADVRRGRRAGAGVRVCAIGCCRAELNWEEPSLASCASRGVDRVPGLRPASRVGRLAPRGVAAARPSSTGVSGSGGRSRSRLRPCRAAPPPPARQLL
ncbi:hypothetical protein MC885_009756, partial [Smutsia gigantea]